VRIVFDFVFNFIIGILLLEIFSGILTDTFAKIRSEQEELNSIQESRCFVCDKESKEFADFKFHTQYEHNLWDYIIYIYTLIYSKDNKYQELMQGEKEGLSWEKENEYTKGEISITKHEHYVKGIEYLKAVIDKELLLESSDDYVRACLAHYELTLGGEAKSFENKRYLSWLPYNLTSMDETKIEIAMKRNLEENAKSTREEFEIKVEEIVDSKVKELEKKIAGFEEKMNKKLTKILTILKKK
jgi:hypothetical protein